MAAIIRSESRRRFEKQGLVKTRQALQRGIANPTEKLEAQNWVGEEAEATAPKNETPSVVVGTHTVRGHWRSRRWVIDCKRVIASFRGARGRDRGSGGTESSSLIPPSLPLKCART
jgi:hypothetical protein